MEEFKIGQPVICIKDHSKGSFKKGQIFIVQGVQKNPCCGGLTLNVGIKTGYVEIRCTCGKVRKNDDYYGAILFKPSKSEFKTISYSKVLEKEKEFVGVN